MIAGLFALVGWCWAISLYRQTKEQQQVLETQASLVRALKDVVREKDAALEAILRVPDQPLSDLAFLLMAADVTADRRYRQVH